VKLKQTAAMKNLYAVYIAINDYALPVTPLKGCVRDAETLSGYIADRYESQFQHHIKKLTNKEATRANVIAVFEHFEAAKDGDVCLFYFAGHGSRMASPALFEHLEADGKLETLVCYDSRNGSGDLIDKELSYLIWKATKDKDIHFVTIMDCCHSGSNTKGIPEIIGERQSKNAAPPTALKIFLGFKDYQQKQQDKWTPPSGKHIALSACLSSQTAKEVYVNKQPTGVFTYFLVEALKETSGNIDYNNLLSKVNTKVGLFVKDQSPQVMSEATDKSLKFLSQQKWEANKNYLIKYDKKLRQWVVNLGAIHGVKKGNDYASTIFKLEGIQQTVLVDEVFATQSTIKGIKESNRRKVFEARLIQLGVDQLKIGLSDKLTDLQVEQLQGAYQQDAPWLFDLVEDERAVQYLIRKTKAGFGLCAIGNDAPLFESLRTWNTAQIKLFLTRINVVCRWANLLQLNNPMTSISSDAIELTFYRLTEVRHGNDDAKKEQLDWSKRIELPYLLENHQPHPPSFQVKVKNTSDQLLWVSGLYLQRNFAIHNNLLTKTALAPQQEQWLEVVQDDFRTRNIEVQIEEEFLIRNITEIKEYLKVLVSTKEFNTDDFVQEALPQEGSQKGTGDRAVCVHGDWRSYELELVVQHHQI